MTVTLHGIYYFGKKRVACRNDYCANCQRPALTEGFRSVMVVHMMFVPLLPIGFKTRWMCQACRQPLEAKQPSRPGLLLTGVILAIIFSISALAAGIHDDDLALIFCASIFGPLTVFGLARMLLKEDRASFAAGKARVQPLPRDTCPYCHGPLLQRTTARCHNCKVNVL